jgi:hypothetical protein
MPCLEGKGGTFRYAANPIVFPQQAHTFYFWSIGASVPSRCTRRGLVRELAPSGPRWPLGLSRGWCKTRLESARRRPCTPRQLNSS